MSTTLDTLLSHTQAFRYMNVASIVVLYYDYLLTLKLEVELIWPYRWSVIKIMFVIARYSPLLDSIVVFYHHFTPNVSPASCVMAYKANGWMYSFGGCLAEGGSPFTVPPIPTIITLRTWAVWRNNKVVRIGLPVFFASIWTAQWVILAKFLPTLEFGSLQGVSGCIAIQGSPILSVTWTLLMVFNFGAFALMAVWVFVYQRHTGARRSDLLQTVYRDGITYYFYLFVISLLNVILIQKLPADLVNLLTTLERVMQAILGCRVLLHIRERGVSSLGDDSFL